MASTGKDAVAVAFRTSSVSITNRSSMSRLCWWCSFLPLPLESWRAPAALTKWNPNCHGYSQPYISGRVAQWWQRLEHIFLGSSSEPQPPWISTGAGTSVGWQQLMPARDLPLCCVIPCSNSPHRHSQVLCQPQSENNIVTAEFSLIPCLIFKASSCERQRRNGMELCTVFYDDS